jgi:hypothetical protein
MLPYRDGGFRAARSPWHVPSTVPNAAQMMLPNTIPFQGSAFQICDETLKDRELVGNCACFGKLDVSVACDHVDASVFGGWDEMGLKQRTACIITQFNCCAYIPA